MLERHLIFCHPIIYLIKYSLYAKLNSMIKDENGKMFDAVSVRLVMFSNRVLFFAIDLLNMIV